MVTMAFGVLALLGWVSGWLRLASFGPNLIPMAPSTAVLFLLYGAAIGLCARPPLSRRAHWCSVAMAGSATLVVLLLFTLGCLHIHWAVEHLGLNLTETVGGAPIGHISLATAFCFLLASGSFLASLAPSATRPWRAALAQVSAGVLLGVCFIFLLAYGFGAPLLYSGTFIPPSLPTILAFSTMGLALLILARRSGGLFRRLPGGDFQPAFIFVLIFFLLAMGIVVTGYAYYRNFERHFRVEAEQQLAAIAELKVGELAQYRKERLGDAFILHNNPAFTQLARRFLESPADADAQRQLQAWLGKYQIHYQYNQVFLLDAQGGVRMSVPESPVPMSALISSRTAEVLRSGQPVFQDFYRHESSHRIYLSLMVPIHDEADGNRPLGVVVLRIDPTSYLYPFIRRWPMPSETAETLRESEVRFRQLADNITDVFWITSPDFAIMHYVSPGFERIWGRSVASLYAQPHLWSEAIHPEEREQVFARLTGLSGNNPEVSVEYRIARPDGSIRWIYDRAFQVRDAAGKVIRLTGIASDITERKQAEEVLRRSEERFRILFDRANDGILLLASDGRLISVNQSFARMHGYSIAEMSQMNLKDLDTPDTLQKAPERFARLMAGETLTFEVEHYHKNGHVFPLEVSAGLVFLDEHSLIQSFHRDITERKQTAEDLRQSRRAALNMMTDALNARDRSEQMSKALQESEAKLRIVIDCSPVPLAINDAQNHITYVNREFTKTFGYDLGDIPTLPDWWQKAYPDPTYQDWVKTQWQLGFNKALQEGTPFEPVEANIRCKDGSQRVALVAATPLTSTFAGTHLVVLYDITERKRAEVEIRELNRSLEQRVQERTSELIAANKELDAFAYAVSHDLRQPLRAMNGFSQILLEDHGASLPGEARKDLDEIILASRQMGELIDGLLRLSRSTLGEVRRDAVDLSALAARILAELAAGEPNRRVTWTVEPGMAVRGDERMIEVVLANLLGNAWKYTARQPVAKIEVGVMDQCCDGVAAPAQNANTPILHHSNTPVFFVCDNGAGFDMKHAARLFQPFQRLHREDEFPGIGIGLATVQRVVHRHGGTIRAAAAPGKGVTFYFSLSSPDAKNKEEL